MAAVGEGNALMTRYYKIARPDGFDFYTGKTINYRDAIGGKPVRAPAARGTNPELCSPSVLHASEIAEQCFVGGKVPCSLYVVEGRSVVHDSQKHGFRQLRVIEELDPATHFEWRYAEAADPWHPFKLPPREVNGSHIELLRSWASVRDSVWDSANSVWDSANSVGDSARAYIGYLFSPVISDWKHVQHEPGTYPFQPAVDLWHQGLVPSFDGKLWRLHGHSDARILWEGEL